MYNRKNMRRYNFHNKKVQYYFYVYLYYAIILIIVSLHTENTMLCKNCI